ncbi:MAG TPA: hypothetical protein EYG92_06325 [Lutibacter sp.]|nr:hypothetical protein [Lutibacter sp.]
MMKKNQVFLQIILFLAVPFLSFSQNFSGYSYDNFSGIQRLSLNPAYVVDSPYNVDINLFGGSIFVGNDYAVLDFGDKLLKGEFDTIDDSIFKVIDESTGSEANNFNFNSELLGPSFMFNLGKSSAIGVFTKARYVISVSDINVAAYDRFVNEGFDTGADYSLDILDSAISTHLWGEVGLTYGRVLHKTDYSLFKAGASFKYIQGGGNAFIAFKNTVIKYNATSPETVDTSGELSYGASFDIDGALDGGNGGISDYFNGDASGIGFDIGAVYQWSDKLKEGEEELKRPRFYKYRLAISVTDIGSINYPTGSLKKYDLNKIGINPDDLEGDDFLTIIDNLYTGQISDDKLVVQLPTAAHINFDYSLTDHLYINLNGDFTLSDVGNNAGEIVPSFLLTPRYESKWISAYLPINYDAYKNMAMGIGVRLGPVFVGSNTALSALFKPIKKVDLHFGVKIPLYKKIKKKTQEEDEN